MKLGTSHLGLWLSSFGPQKHLKKGGKLRRIFFLFGLVFSSCSTFPPITACVHGVSGANCQGPSGAVDLLDQALNGYECYSPEDAQTIREWIKRNKK